LFATPNAKNFVPIVTKLCRNCHIDEFVLRLLKSAQQIEEYQEPMYCAVAGAEIETFSKHWALEGKMQLH